jgi:hypothetical protein
VAAFEDLCRELFDAADERFLIEEEELLVNSYSLDRQYALTCSMADEVEGPWEGTLEVLLSSDAPNAAASIYEDVFDADGSPLEAAWEVTVRWHGPAVSDPSVAQPARAEIAGGAGVPAEEISAHLAGAWDGDDGTWVFVPTFEYGLWLADDEDPDEDAARIMSIGEDGLERLQQVARTWPIVELPGGDDEDEVEEPLDLEDDAGLEIPVAGDDVDEDEDARR